ncbi:hypothetical protein EMIT0P258_140086 [Pseudomonas sp. IT-P258]
MGRRCLDVLIGNRAQAFEAFVQTYEQVKLVSVFRHGITAQTQIRISDLPLKVADNWVESHSRINEVLHHHFGKNEFAEGGAVRHKRRYLAPGLSEKIIKRHPFTPNSLRAASRSNRKSPA